MKLDEKEVKAIADAQADKAWRQRNEGWWQATEQLKAMAEWAFGRAEQMFALQASNLRALQLNSTSPMDDYHTGLYNGMEMLSAVVEDREPRYLSSVEKKSPFDYGALEKKVLAELSADTVKRIESLDLTHEPLSSKRASFEREYFQKPSPRSPTENEMDVLARKCADLDRELLTRKIDQQRLTHYDQLILANEHLHRTINELKKKYEP